jgi:hypothetical protein
MTKLSIKKLLKKGYVVTDQWGNVYEGRGIKPHSKAVAKSWKKRKVRKQNCSSS